MADLVSLGEQIIGLLWKAVYMELRCLILVFRFIYYYSGSLNFSAILWGFQVDDSITSFLYFYSRDNCDNIPFQTYFFLS